MRVCDRCNEEKKPREFLDDSVRCKDCSMFRVTADGILDYQVCSLYFKYKYMDEEGASVNNRTLMLERFQNTLRRVVNFFFYKKQAGTPPSYNALLNRWERLWFPSDMDAYDLKVAQQVVSHGNLTQYSTRAALALKKMYEDFESPKIEPIMISQEFSTPLSTNIIMDGVIDLMYRENGQHHVVTWGLTPQATKPHMIPIKLTGIKMAYQGSSSFSEDTRYSLYNMASEKVGSMPIPDETFQEDMVKYWANEAYNGGYIPRRGHTAYCKGCPFDDLCKDFWSESGKP